MTCSCKNCNCCEEKDIVISSLTEKIKKLEDHIERLNLDLAFMEYSCNKQKTLDF